MSIKINKNLEDSIVDSIIVDTQLTTEEWKQDTSETVLSWIAHSHIHDMPSSKIEISEYLKYLDAKLSSVRKTATFWDAYNIRESVSTVEDFMQKYAALPTNSSLVINTGSLQIGGKVYKRGDIVIKDNFGQEVDVPSTLSGVYVPNSIESLSGGNLRLRFDYQSVKSADQIDLELPTAIRPTDGAMYSTTLYSKNLRPNTSIAVHKSPDGAIAMPFWECREYDEEKNLIKDRIFNLVEIKLDGDYWVFTNLDNTYTLSFVVIVK